MLFQLPHTDDKPLCVYVHNGYRDPLFDPTMGELHLSAMKMKGAQKKKQQLVLIKFYGTLLRLEFFVQLFSTFLGKYNSQGCFQHTDR